ncbi:MAG: hypothetical protein PHP62_01045 [Candidatus Moranbacteria bacterium]|nr:hypothetical protein [Candidatus Moranbacteria bacterium]
MAAPLVIIKKVVQEGKKLTIILYESAKDDNISYFFRLCFNFEGGDEYLILDLIEKIAKNENTTYSIIMDRIRTEKRLSFQLSLEEKVSFLEFYLENKKESKRKILVE